ncbi:carboxymuconolactone decarboxylase family protein [Roseovarius sp. ZX-A-9]|uniref:carboxymuconolactone decarboxylase family protein n=1 Tax=Roseovarius sp. ZX-A-9 TaxID=3014783 RepID=UPI00232D745F|nr:carboxymuconolactone decarboxylase family protein [Roseovarius sp. ZX-A-9]
MDWKAFLGETEKRIGTLTKVAPEMAKGYGTMSRAAKKNGALDEKTKELVALGIAITTRCESCIGFHVRSLVRLGTSRDEIIETLEMAAYMGAGPGITYGAKALEAFDQFAADRDGDE